MVKCDFPGCPNDEAMLFRCDRCTPPKYYCSNHKLPPNHNCIGLKAWKSTKSPSSNFTIGYQKSSSIKVIGNSGYFYSEEKSAIISKSSTVVPEKLENNPIWVNGNYLGSDRKSTSVKITSKPWYSKLLDKIKQLFKLK